MEKIEMKKETNYFLIFNLIYFLLIGYAVYVHNYEYILDISSSIIALLTAFVFYKTLNLNNTIFFVIFFAMLLHDFGVFGFYNFSPLPFEYDHLTHLFGGLSLAILFINFIIKSFGKNKKVNSLLIIVAILAALGIGSIIEITEFGGYLVFGKGEGLFYFGGIGDLGKSNILEGAWENSAIDMFYNSVGAILGCITYFIYKKTK